MTFRMSGLNTSLAVAGLAGLILMATASSASAVLTSDAGLDFGLRHIGYQSSTLSMHVTNEGGPVTGLTCSVGNGPSGNNPMLFPLQATCPTSVAVGGSFDVYVAFVPATVGAKGALVTINYTAGASDASLTFDLDGTGFDGRDLFVNTDWSPVSFGDQGVSDGATTPTRLVAMNNPHASDPLSIDNFNRSGDCGEFNLTFPGTPLTLSAATTPTVTFSVNFDPSSTGYKSCTIQFDSDDPDDPDELVLSGTGIAPDLILTAESSPLGFGSQQISAGATAPKTVVITNSAAADDDLFFSDADAFDVATDTDCDQFEFSFPTTPLTLAPSQTSSFAVAFNPSAASFSACDIFIYSNDPDSPHTFRVQGTGTASTINLTPTSANYNGGVVLGDEGFASFTISNPGSATAILTILALGLDNTIFTVMPPTPPPDILLNPGASQPVSVRCIPTGLGEEFATLTVVHDADIVGNDSAALTCRGVKPDVVITPPGTQAFGDQQIFTTNATTLTFTVGAASGDNASPLTVSVTETAGHTGDFGLSSDTASCVSSSCTIAPGSTEDFDVTFRPTAIGPRGVTITIASDDQDPGQNSQTLEFTGDGINPEIASPDAPTSGVGDVLLGSFADDTITIQNIGTTPLEISSVFLTGGNVGEFSIQSGATGASSIGAGGSADWTVRCAPTVEAPRSTTFRVQSNDRSEPSFNISLTCTGVQPQLEVSPAIAFPPTYDCTSATEMTITLTNQGSAPLTINNITSSSSVFAITTPPVAYPIALDPDAFTTIGITFTPATVADYNETLTIAWDPAGPMEVQMTGSGRLAAASATPMTYNYGDVRIDGAASQNTYVVENTGTHDFTISLLQLDNTTDFTLVDIDAAGTTLAPTDTASFRVDALPTALGGASGTVEITTTLPSACSSPIEIDVAAVGVIPDIELLPATEVGFGPYDILAGAAASRTLTVTNSGTAVLTVSDIQVTGDSQFALASGQETAFEVAVDASVSVNVEYMPTMVENNTALLEVTSDVGGGVPIEIDVTGRGVDRELNLSTTGLDFPATYRNTETPSTLDFTIENLGEATLNITTVERTGAGAAAFVLAADVPATVAGVSSATITVEFTPTAAGEFLADLVLTSDDTDEGVANIELSGIGRVPNIAAPTMPVDLGRIGVGVPTRLSETSGDLIELVNMEADSFMVHELRLVDSAGSPVDAEQFRIIGFAVDQVLAAGESMAIDVEFVAEAEGDYELTLEVYLDADPLRVAIVTIRAQAVVVTLRGGGCQSGAGGSGTALVLLMLAGLLLAVWRRGRAIVVVVAVAGVLASPPAHAERTRNLDLTTFRPMPGVDSTMMSVEVPQVGAAGAWFLGFFVDHAVNPLNLGSPSVDGSDALVSGRTAAALAFSYALANRYEAGLLVPMLSQSGTASTVITGVAPAEGTVLGDIAVHGKMSLYNATPLALGASATLTLPTASDAEFAGVNGPTAHLRVIAGFDSGRVELAANGGMRLRKKGELADLTQGHELTYGVAGSYQVLGKLAAIGELYGAFSLSGGVSTAVSPLEVALGVRYRLNRELGLVVGGGSGIMPGIGAADMRAFMLLAFSSKAREIPVLTTIEQIDTGDDDGDSVINSNDRCPNEAEDRDEFEDEDGCPDPDNDGDGLLDEVDPCPRKAEDKDGFKDDDGCPDDDNDEDGIPDSKDRCPDEPEDKDGYQDRDGCDDPDNDSDGIPDVIDQCALEAETINGNKDDDGCPDPGDSLVMVMPDRIEAFEPVRFRGNSAKILMRSHKVLNQVAATLRANRDFVRVRVAVHVHPRKGSDLTLTKRRAEAVRKWLINWGVEPERLESKGYGSGRLLVPKKSKDARKINDRVEFIIIEKRVKKAAGK